MKILTLGALSASCLAVAACSSTGQQAFLQDIQTCSRHYNGSIAAGVVGGGNFTGTVKIDCDPVSKAPAAQ